MNDPLATIDTLTAWLTTEDPLVRRRELRVYVERGQVVVCADSLSAPRETRATGLVAALEAVSEAVERP